MEITGNGAKTDSDPKEDRSIFQAIRSMLRDASEMEEVVQELRREANALIARLEEIECPSRRLNAACVFYYLHPEIKVSNLAKAVTGKPHTHFLLEEIKKAGFGLPCERCEGKVYLTRGDAQWMNKNKAWVVCEDCRRIEREKWHEELRMEREQEGLRARRRLEELRVMPYREYLQTPEWQTRRLRHLKSARFRCQLCNAAETTLDVHHRTYERRGDELYSDLVVLCRSCHEHHHSRGS